MGEVLSLQNFTNTVRQQRGMTSAAVAELVHFYEGAARAARLALPNIPSLGFFSSQNDRIAAFISTCKRLDALVEQRSVNRDEAQIAIVLLTFSDKNFFKATQAFTRWAVPRYRDDLTTNSEAADYYLRSVAAPY